jgi:hypothetical protein
MLSTYVLQKYNRAHVVHIRSTIIFIVERMRTTWALLYYCRAYVDNMVCIILLLNVCEQHGAYSIIVERM